MSQIVESIRLIYVEVGENSNKFYDGDLFDDGRIELRWGRVGATGQSQTISGSSSTLEKKKKSKLKKGYVEQRTIQESGGGSSRNVGDSELHQIATDQIQYSSPVAEKLVNRLIKSNIHRITANTNISYDDSSGLFQTPLGVVTPDGITDARALLVAMHSKIGKRKSQVFYGDAGEYLKIVPQTVGRNVKAFVDAHFSDANGIQKQQDLLDSLQASYDSLGTAKKGTTKKAKKDHEQVFNVEINPLDESDPTFKKFKKHYYKTRKAMHHYDNVEVKRIYAITMNDMVKAFDKKLGNIQWFYHGTGIANCLSIMKSGLRTAPPSSAAIAGKMFGNGVYGANCASKSLGYSLGRWGQGSSNDSAWLFICDFAMGKTDEVTSYGCRGPKKGHHSVSAFAGKTGLCNDEFIVYKNNQVNITHLIECEA